MGEHSDIFLLLIRFLCVIISPDFCLITLNSDK